MATTKIIDKGVEYLGILTGLRVLDLCNCTRVSNDVASRYPVWVQLKT